MYLLSKIWYCICFPKSWALLQACTSNKGQNKFRELPLAHMESGKAVSLILAAPCVRREGRQHALENKFLSFPRRKRKRCCHIKSAVSLWRVYTYKGGNWTGPRLHCEYSSSVIRSGARRSFSKAVYGIWTDEHFLQLNTCQLCINLSFAKKEIFNWVG